MLIVGRLDIPIKFQDSHLFRVIKVVGEFGFGPHVQMRMLSENLTVLALSQVQSRWMQLLLVAIDGIPILGTCHVECRTQDKGTVAITVFGFAIDDLQPDMTVLLYLTRDLHGFGYKYQPCKVTGRYIELNFVLHPSRFFGITRPLCLFINGDIIGKDGCFRYNRRIHGVMTVQ
eukprot:scaffold8266_cov175-Amphora_coffeaeformis.AAC.1